MVDLPNQASKCHKRGDDWAENRGGMGRVESGAGDLESGRSPWRFIRDRDWRNIHWRIVIARPLEKFCHLVNLLTEVSAAAR